MTWATVAVLAVGVWGQRLLGMFVGARVVGRQPALARLATLIPAAVVKSASQIPPAKTLASACAPELCNA